MSFFYDLNKKLDGIRATPEVTHQQLNGRDMGKHNNATTGFKAVADKAAKEYGSKAAGERVAGAVKAKMAKAGKLEEQDMDESAFQAAIGKKKYGDEGMKALQKAGRDHAGAKTMSNIRNKYDKYDEGVMDTVKSVGKKVASGVNKLVGHGSDEEMRKDLQRKSGAPVTGKKPEQRSMREAAGPVDYEKVLEAIAALYGDDMWDNDAMGDLAQDLEQAGPTDRELDFIIAKGKLPTRLKGIRFTNTDDVQFGHLDEKSGEPMSSKQKSFAALAPPKDKITFADKIAGAKKEVDEMLGDVAAEAMRSALSGGQKKLDKNHNGKLDANDFAMLRKGAKKGHSGEMDEEKSKGTAFDMSAPRQVTPKVGSVERGHKHDIKHTATGRMVTRRVDDQGNSVGADDASDAQAGPRGRGRPKGTKGAIGAKGPSGRSKLITKEGDVSTGHLQQMYNQLIVLKSHVQDPDGQASLKELISMVKHYMNQGKEAPVEEEKTSTRDAHAEKAGKKVTKDIEYDEKKKDGIHGKKRGPEDAKAEKAGKKVAKDIEYDEKKKDKEEEVDESTTSAGSVAPSTATKGNKGGVFGKGIYDSMNFELEQMIAESMSINMSDSTEGGKSLTITATDDDALKLGMMLKNAGLGGGDQHSDDMHSHGEESCPTCGMEDCGCGDVHEAVDENAPDWPTNTEKADNNFGYSGGLNKPKSSGMATIPVTDVQVDGEDMFSKPVHEEDALSRMMEMAGIKQAELEPWKETMKEEAEDICSDCHKDPCECEESVEESIQRMRAIAGIKEAKKPDFLDMDKDGNKKEPMSKAIKDKEEKKVEESIFALTNQWKAYRG